MLVTCLSEILGVREAEIHLKVIIVVNSEPFVTRLWEMSSTVTVGDFVWLWMKN